MQTKQTVLLSREQLESQKKTDGCYCRSFVCEGLQRVLLCPVIIVRTFAPLCPHARVSFAVSLLCVFFSGLYSLNIYFTVYLALVARRLLFSFDLISLWGRSGATLVASEGGGFVNWVKLQTVRARMVGNWVFSLDSVRVCIFHREIRSILQVCMERSIRITFFLKHAFI